MCFIASAVFKFFGSRSNVFDLKSEIKKIMFEGNRLRQISIDGGLFTMIMANFSQFEKVVSNNYKRYHVTILFILFQLNHCRVNLTPTRLVS